MTNEQMRRDFEHWFSYEGEIPQAVERNGSSYRTGQAARAWWAWQAATLKERERCALVCDAIARDSEESIRNSQYEKGCDDCADAIRVPQATQGENT
jgi:hypothetical protein